MQKQLSQKEKKQIFSEQNNQYEFPYHHIPHILADGSATRLRYLDWGFDYLACQLHVKQFVESQNINSVLEVGCGDGAIIGSISKNITQCRGIDLSERAIKQAKAFYPDIKFSTENTDEIKEKFDAVIAIEVLEHIPDDEVNSFLLSLGKKTNKGGYMYISVPSINLPLYKKHYRHYDVNLLKSQIDQSGLDVEFIELRYFRSPVLFEDTYKRLTNNRFWMGEIHPVRRYIWKKIINSLEIVNESNAQHVIAILKMKK